MESAGCSDKSPRPVGQALRRCVGSGRTEWTHTTAGSGSLAQLRVPAGAPSEAPDTGAAPAGAGRSERIGASSRRAPPRGLGRRPVTLAGLRWPAYTHFGSHTTEPTHGAGRDIPGAGSLWAGSPSPRSGPRAKARRRRDQARHGTPPGLGFAAHCRSRLQRPRRQPRVARPGRGPGSHPESRGSAGDGPARFKDAPGDVENLVEAVGSRPRFLVPPEEFHDLLAVKMMVGRQGEYLDEVPPLRSRHAVSAMARDPTATRKPPRSWIRRMPRAFPDATSGLIVGSSTPTC